MEHPFFSIVIPSRNRPRQLARALESVTAQTFRAFETIVVNDGSTCDYAEVKSQYADMMRYVENPEAKGVSHARNVAIGLARGSWVAFLDDDDEFTQHHLHALHDAIALEPEVDFLWCDVNVHSRDANGGPSVRRRRWKRQYRDREELYRDALAIGAGFGLTVKKTYLEGVGGFDDEMRIGEDVDLVTKLLAHGAMPRPLESVGVIKHEEHADRLSYDGEAYSKERVFERIVERNLDFFRVHQLNKMSLLVWAATLHSQYGNVRFEADCVKEVWKMGYRKSAIKYLLRRVLGDRVELE